MYKVLITTSGTGSRLKELTKDTNKALIEINGKKVIDYIITSYSSEIELVITIGYYGDKVREYISQMYPERDITFVEIDKYEGLGSSLGYSMLQAQDFLQCPFIFHCNDTIINGSIPSPEEYNWDGVSEGNDQSIFNTQSYSSVMTNGEDVIELNGKGSNNWNYLHIGLVGVKDYKAFWEYLNKSYRNNPSDTSLNDCVAISEMIKEGYKFKSVVFKEWVDTGNLTSLDNAFSRLH